MLTTGITSPFHSRPHYYHLRHHDHRWHAVHHNTFFGDAVVTSSTSKTFSASHHTNHLPNTTISNTTASAAVTTMHASYTQDFLYSLTTTATAMNATTTTTTTITNPDDYYSMDGNFTSGFSSTPVFPEYIKVVSTFFCCLVLVVGVVGNVLVPVVILKDRDMRNSTNYFLMNLSVADLLVLLICLPPVLVELHSPPQIWVMGYGMCEYC